MDCHNCGQPMNEDDQFCPTCGTKNPTAEAMAASLAAGVSMSAAESTREPAVDHEAFYEDEYEQIVTKKNSLLPVFLTVGAAIILIAGILILLLKTNDPDDKRLGFTPPADSNKSNPIYWQTLPAFEQDQQEAHQTESTGFIWTMPSEPAHETQSTTTGRAAETTSEIEIIIDTQVPSSAAPADPAGSKNNQTPGPTGSENNQTTKPAGSENNQTTGPSYTAETTGETFQLAVNRIDAGMFPRIRLYFSLTDETDNMFKPGNASSFSLTETLKSDEQMVENARLKDSTEFIVLVDGSTLALNEGNINAVKTALRSLADTMLPEGNDKNKLGIAMFRSTEQFTLPAQILCIDQSSAAEQINKLTASGVETDERPLYDTLSEAVIQLHNRGYRGEILVYTAGDDNGSVQSHNELISRIADSGISINLMSLTQSEKLSVIGSKSYGSYTYLENGQSLGSNLLNCYSGNREKMYLDYTSPFTEASSLDKISVKIAYTDSSGGNTAEASHWYSPPAENIRVSVQNKTSAVQDLKIERIDAKSHPAVRLYFTLSDTSNNFVKPCSLAAVSITEKLGEDIRSVTETRLKDRTEFAVLVDGGSQTLTAENIDIVKSAFANLAQTMLPEDNEKNKLGISIFRNSDSLALPIMATDLAAAEEQIDALSVSPKATGERPLYDVLQKAVTRLSADGYDGSIMLFAGGPDAGSKSSLADLKSLINNSGIPIHIITIQPCDDLELIGLSSHGSYSVIGSTEKKEGSDNLSDLEILSAVLQAKYLWETLYIDYQSPFAGIDAQDELTVKLVYTNLAGTVQESEFDYSIPRDS